MAPEETLESSAREQGEHLRLARAKKGFRTVEFVVVFMLLLLLAETLLLCFTGLGSWRWDWPAAGRDPFVRVADDLRTIHIALATYYVDNCAYPEMVPLRDAAPDVAALTDAGGVALTTYRASFQYGQSFGLTSPISYIGAVPPDPFSPGGELPHAYYARRGGSLRCSGAFILSSPGPDRRYDIDPAENIDWNRPFNEEERRLRASGRTYDPSNGTVSPGDIWLSDFEPGISGTPSELFERPIEGAR